MKRRTLNPVVSPEMKQVGEAEAISRAASHREPRAKTSAALQTGVVDGIEVEWHKENKMADTPQTFANHTRWQPPIHYFVLPVMLINVIFAVVLFIRDPAINSGWWIVVSAALLTLVIFVRLNPLKAQDRIIRLEERLRYQQLLSKAVLQQTNALTPGQIIALRFAGDDELEELVNAVLAGKFQKHSDIKRAIKHWRADSFRI